MNSLLDILKRIYPNMLQDMKQRYDLMRHVNLLQPIGRRSLADVMGLTERTIRSEIELLQEQRILHVTNKGMFLTQEGKYVLEQLVPFIKELSGLNELEQKVKKQLGLEKIIIVPGNSDEEKWAKLEMGRACANYLDSIMTPEATIAVTGGSTIAAVAEQMEETDGDNQYLFVPARGGFGENVEYQANTIVAKMAQKTNSSYRMLFMPDVLSEASFNTMRHEPAIHAVLERIKEAQIVLHGLGDAITMARRRDTPQAIIEKLIDEEAVAEAFGYYFNKNGHIIHQVVSTGIDLEDLVTKEHVIAVAGGLSKAEAISAYFKTSYSKTLITDEGAAIGILRDASL
ncbi:central glycolytic genes regulator [Cerasibacillus quisquiliarum]|uniref:Central glycolytic genes regulator n=1 Tax=Cerasibacillus quisquiliarum TaxID=227865 RepID=A0A511UWN3_9BACI|nr:sugar-binding domain-containing protein [Cerasibacillus quisquiliarum]MBB5145237.1 central glycolytic genes regulator [Cerasibacillus quisquiliarum]GEN29873.1 central glycolytic genes regulator [Cerasibacillus quisquiliarum]